MIDFKGHRVEKDIILLCVRWYLAYPLSYRNLEEMMEERGIQVDHSNIYRWVQKFTPPLEAAFRNGKKRRVGSSWRGWTRLTDTVGEFQPVGKNHPKPAQIRTNLVSTRC